MEKRGEKRGRRRSGARDEGKWTEEEKGWMKRWLEGRSQERGNETIRPNKVWRGG